VQQKGIKHMRRLLMVFTVAVLTAVMLAAMAGPAFASKPCPGDCGVRAGTYSGDWNPGGFRGVHGRFK
jgi:hypothetical protein